MPDARIRITHGTPRLEWCDQCLVTHAFLNVYDADRPDLPPLGLMADHLDDARHDGR